MTNIYAWSASQDPVASTSPSPSELAADIRSVADLWVSTAYDDLRPAGPDRAAQVRWILERYVHPWFAPQTDTIGDVTYFISGCMRGCCVLLADRVRTPVEE